MLKPYTLILILYFLFRCTKQHTPPGTECGISLGRYDRSVKVTLDSRRSPTGEWLDTLEARAEHRNSSSYLILDVTHSTRDCDGKRVMYIKGVMKDASVEEKIKFHPRCGKNIAIGNRGLTVQRIDLDDPYNSVAFTNRPLRDNELFDVNLDMKITKYKYGLGIGVTTISPSAGEILPEMYKSPKAWMYHGQSIYSNNKEYLPYKVKGPNELQVGDKIGVLRNEYGALHFFVNGVDQGPAMSNVPEAVYGVLDLRYNHVKATIVN